MDSGNSGSFQSSSGDEEHDSRPPVDSISALMNINSNKRRAIHGIQANPSSQINSANFDLLSNYFDAISRPPPPSTSLLNLDMSWSKTLRSDLNSSADHHPNQAAAMISPSSSNIQPFFGSSSFTATATATTTTAINPPENNNNNAPRPAASDHVVRNPKKRSRASRRAPTTVLTTDTTNFRAMVQEFTGIPAPPFTSSSLPFSRHTLYGPTTTPSSLRSNPLDSSSSHSQPPSYLRRPFPQKPPSLPFLASSSSAVASSSSPLLNSTSMVDLDLDIDRTSAALNFQVFNNLNPNNLILSSALLQAKFPPNNPAPVPVQDIGSLGGLPGLIPSDQTTTTTAARNNNNPVNWDGGNGKMMNFSSPANIPSSFHGEKGSDHNVAVTAASRGEGMVESWICSSD